MEGLPPPTGVEGLGFVVCSSRGCARAASGAAPGGCVCACGPAPAIYGGESCVWCVCVRVCDNTCVILSLVRPGGRRARGLERGECGVEYLWTSYDILSGADNGAC